jgi:2-polyprenyl-6-hydroxyphenyl methylase/3-demethylubiquinone-9 3-methyltransferase
MNAGEIRPGLTAKLRAPSNSTLPCKICGGEARPLGIVDFNRSCEEVRGLWLPRVGVPIQYRRCVQCGLLFTDAFDDWTQADFEAHVYNDAYAIVDPDYAAKRPHQFAAGLTKTFEGWQGELDILDYGGGNGAFAEGMRATGFRCEPYDPFDLRFAARPDRRFNLITCIETLEHMPNPVAGVGDIASLVTDEGAVLFATLAQPPDIGQLGLGWWYVGPRNGHVTLYSRVALALLWARFGFTMSSFNDNIHLATRGVPAFVRHLTGGRAG